MNMFQMNTTNKGSRHVTCNISTKCTLMPTAMFSLLFMSEAGTFCLLSAAKETFKHTCVLSRTFHSAITPDTVMYAVVRGRRPLAVTSVVWNQAYPLIAGSLAAAASLVGLHTCEPQSHASSSLMSASFLTSTSITPLSAIVFIGDFSALYASALTSSFLATGSSAALPSSSRSRFLPVSASPTSAAPFSCSFF